jgi:outer membrane protein assembly factor BamB/serine/threonine protein kinase
MADNTGQQLGNYRLSRRLGVGGSAEVYLGEHLYLGTLAAIKVLHFQIGSDELETFRNEARTIAHLLHPHIVRVLDFGVEGTKPFLVMDYASGGTLRQRYPRGTRLPLDQISANVQQVASALQYSHERKIIHRDVKPENMLLDGHDQILLSDFGISAIEQSTSMMITQSQVHSNAVGTVYYMAPEQIQGSPHPASDQYALGIVVYEWLCGAPPFVGEPFAIMYQHVNMAPLPLHEKLPDISPQIEQVVLKALAKDPLLRYPTVMDFALALDQARQAQDEVFLATMLIAGQRAVDDLPTEQGSFSAEDPTVISRSLQPNQPYQSSQPQPNQPYPFPELAPIKSGRGPSTRQRRRPLIAMTMILVTIAFLLVIGSVALYLSSSNKPGNASSSHGTLTTAERNAHASATSNARATATITASLDAYNTAAINGIMAGFNAEHTRVNPFEKIISSANVAHLTLTWKTSAKGEIGSAATIANGIAYINANSATSGNGLMLAIDVKSGKVLWTAPIGSYDFGCAPLVAHGIVYMGSWDTNLYAFNAQKGNVLWTAHTGGRIGSSPTLANGVIYIGSDDGSLYAFNATNGTKLWSFRTNGPIRSSPAVANGVVYVGSKDTNLYAIHASSGTLMWKFTTGGEVTSSPAVANGIVYFGSGDHTLYALNAATGSSLWEKQTGGSINASPAVANFVVYVGSEDHTLYAFDAAKGNLLWQAATGAAIDSSPTIANGVLYIGSKDQKLYAFNASGCGKTTCTPLWSFTTGGGIASSPSVANGVVYVGSNDGNLYAFRLAGTTL